MSESRQSDVIVGVHEPGWRAQIVARRDLTYSLGPDPSVDRPPNVRAASGINWLAGQLAIVQDDASFLALVDPHGASVQGIALASDARGLRQFDKSRGNKLDKPDFEACFVVDDTLYALGSGSHANRERIAVISTQGATWQVREHHAPELYRALRECTDFAGSELNVEGAVVVEDRVRFFQRGNGALRGDLSPINATCDVSLAELLAYVAGEGAVPALERVRRYEIGRLSEVALTFTDAAPHPTLGLVFLASAEASDDAIQDGEVMGTAIGALDARGLRWACLLAEDGEPCRDKAEGIVFDAGSESCAYVVVDPDDHELPAQLLTVELRLT